jgi:hypothetical protein
VVDPGAQRTSRSPNALTLTRAKLPQIGPKSNVGSIVTIRTPIVSIPLKHDVIRGESILYLELSTAPNDLGMTLACCRSFC